MLTDLSLEGIYATEVKMPNGLNITRFLSLSGGTAIVKSKFKTEIIRTIRPKSI